jgi:Protein of unknown function (DUF402)
VVFEPGEGIVLRELWRGRVFEARPTIVVCDEPEQLMLLLPGGARCAMAIGADGQELRLPDRPWHLEIRTRGDQPILSFAWPDTPYSVLLWAMADDRRVWYVNLQDPLKRTRLGFDTVDHALDVVVELDGSSWSWKDEEELAEAVRDGLFSAAEAADFHAWGERAVDRILAGEPPFDRGWEDWRPDSVWQASDLREGWDWDQG